MKTKSTFKKILSALLAVSVAAGTMPVVDGKFKNNISAAFTAKAEVFGDFEYKVLDDNDDNTVEILGYTGKDTEVIIPKEIDGVSVTSIGDEAFERCSALTSITIPDGVTSIGNYAFYYCSALTSIEIPASVTSIGDYAFYYCSALTSIEIPSSVTSIGDEAFEKCSALTSIEIPASVTSIGYMAFRNCFALASINVSENNQNYSSADGVFFNKEKSELIKYPEGKTENGYTIPDSVTSIGNEAFYYCSALTSIEIPDSVTSIAGYAFYNCSALTSIEIPDGVTSIGNEAFRDCSALTSITIPDGVTSIGDMAFYNCSALTSIEISDSVTSIGYCAFSGCSALTSIEIPDGVTGIGGYAFYNCSALTSIEIPASVTSIGDYAFRDCSLLTSITIPNSVTHFGYGTVSADDSPFVTIYCNAGSKAEELATQYGIPYSTEPYEPKFNIFENGDNATAVVALKKWMGGVYGETEIEKSADLTRDGEVNVGDVIWLKRHIAGWVGYQFPTYSGGK